MTSGQKPMIRLRALELLRAMTPTGRAERSARIATHLALAAGRLFGFAPLRTEPDWLAAGWGDEIALPRIEGERLVFCLAPRRESLVTGPFGTREPGAEAAEVFPEAGDTILVPGLAFDGRGGRLGRGGGFYDRFLARAAGVRRVGVCFADQIIDEVPMEPHDARVDALVTEAGWLDARSSLSDRG